MPPIPIGFGLDDEAVACSDELRPLLAQASRFPGPSSEAAFRKSFSLKPQDSVVAALRRWSALQPDKTVYTWIDSKGEEQASLSYRELEMRANAVCHALLHEWGCEQDDRAALMYLPGLEFIAVFWGCLFAGVVAVPVYPVDLRGAKFELEVERFGRIVADCEAKLVLSHSEYLNMKRLHAVTNMFGSGSWPQGLEFEATDRLDPRPDCGTGYQPGPEQLAFLQFTSGSTGDPKGVMLSHGNLADNCEQMAMAFGGSQSLVAVSWLPQYHDMGLIAMLLYPAFCGGSTVAMAPLTFIASPLLWLQTISKYKGNQTGAPNFAYVLCLKKTSMQDRRKLDFRHVQMFMNAAEPISPKVVERFIEGFAEAGMQRRMLMPGYGLAENSVFVCCSHTRGVHLEPVITSFHRKELQESQHALPVSADHPMNENVVLVSSGHTCSQTSICIALELDDGQLVQQPDSNLGEICLSSPSKAQGYWGKPQLSQQIFRATIKDDPTGTEYLRTGDLGFIHEGELYICGRLKDLIIVRGKNYYPQDIERTAEASHKLLKPGCSAAFSVEAAGEERLVVVAEVRGEVDEPTQQAVLEALRAAVVVEHGLEVQAALLLKERTVPKTTSGKIKRRACKQGFEDWQNGRHSKLQVVGFVLAEQAQPALPIDDLVNAVAGTVERAGLLLQAVDEPQDAGSIIQAQVQIAVEDLASAGARIGPNDSFLALGIDSVASTQIGNGLAKRTGVEVSGVDILSHPTLLELCTWMLEQFSQDDSVAVDGLIKAVRQLLGPMGQSLDVDVNLFEAGFVSKNVTTLASAMTKRYHIDMTPDVVFENNTLRKLSTWLGEQLASKRQQEQEHMLFHPDDYRLVCEPSTRDSTLSTWISFSLQFLGLASLPVIWSLAAFPCWLLLGIMAEHVSKEAATFMFPLLAVPLLLSQIVIVLLLRPRVPPGSYRVWSWPFIRWWYGQLLFRTVHATAGPLFEDSTFMAYWFQLLGADLGSEVKVSVDDGSCFELLSVGDGSSIGSSVYCHDVWNGLLHIRPVIIGKSCSNGTGSVILPGTVMKDGVELMPNSSVCCTTLHTGKWIGTPPRPHEPALSVKAGEASPPAIAKDAVLPIQGKPDVASAPLFGAAELKDETNNGGALLNRNSVAVKGALMGFKPDSNKYACSNSVYELSDQSEHSVVAALRRWSALQPDKTVYTWIDSKGEEQASFSYRELEMRANAVCHALLHEWGCEQDDRAALMYLPGLEFIAAFWGCLFAGVVAVPVYPVDLRGAKFELEVERFGRIVAACEPRLVLSHGEYLRHKRLHAVTNMFGSGSWPEGLEFEATDRLEPRPDCGTGYQPGPEQLAFLQFTSGSTGDPKGVMLSHGNILHNNSTIGSTFGLESEDTAVSWLPQYHDMGLIGYFLLPVFLGGNTVFMSPMTFLHKPGLWLFTISLHKATWFSAPNFAFQRCVDKLEDIVREHPMDSLALGQLKFAMNAAEPIWPSTLEAFAQSYSGAGFRPEQWACTYGLAENVIYVSGFAHEPVLLTVKRVAMEAGLVVVHVGGASGDEHVQLVGCGKATPGCGISVKIVDPQTLEEPAPDRVGEIWVSGPSKAQGYWGKPELSQQIFRATIQHDPTGTEYLRTGDLGFIHGGELYICGRLKDLIVVRGKNYYPQDIERTAEASHKLLKPGCSAAFSVEAAGEERLVVVAEVRGEVDEPTQQAVLEALRAAVVVEHGLEMQAALLLKERTVPKTTSGKIKRRACKQGFKHWSGLLMAGGDSSVPQLKEVSHYVSSAWNLPYCQAGVNSNGSNRRQFVLRQLFQAVGIVMLPCYLFALALPSILILLYTPPSTLNSHLALLIFGFLVFLLWYVVQMVVLVLVQWLLVGRLRDGQQCHVHSWLVVRMWFVDCLGDLVVVSIYLFDHLTIKYYYLQLLGMSIATTSRAWVYPSSEASLIEIQDSTFVSNVYISTKSSGRDGTLRLHTVSIGNHCDVALKSIVAGTVSDQSMVGSLAWIPEGQVVPSKHTALGTPVKLFEIGFGSGEVPNLPKMPCCFSMTLYVWALCGIPVLFFVALLPAFEVLWSYNSSMLEFIIGGCNRPEYLYVYGHEDLSAHQCIEEVARWLWSVFNASDPGLVLERLVVYACAMFLLLPAMAALEVVLKWCMIGCYQYGIMVLPSCGGHPCGPSSSGLLARKLGAAHIATPFII